jgi:hypothetical protein
MAGQGRAPKPPEQRRNHHAPRAGEWVDMPPLTEPVLPPLPSGSWSARTEAAWAAWAADTATGMYGSADIQLAIDLAYIYEAWVLEPTAALAGEIRQRQDSLGLSPKGRQDRRWRLAATETESTAPSSPPAPRRTARNHLRAVDPNTAVA